jgi:hypothetical protein
MSDAFAALVRLARAAHRKSMGGYQLSLWLGATDTIDQLLDEISEFRSAEVYANGAQHFGKISLLPEGSEIEIRISGLTSTVSACAENLSTLLTFQAGLFQRQMPTEYYLIEEDYFSGEVARDDSDIANFQRMPRFISLLKEISDIYLEDRMLVFLGSKRIDVEVKYSISDLSFVPSLDNLDSLETEIKAAPFVSAKVSMFKNVLCRFLDVLEADKRFGQTVRIWNSIVESYRADFDLYRTEFNFEKVRESFEQKKLDYLLKLNSASADSLTKMLAIPVAQGLLVSQMKADAGSSLANVALLIGSLIFAVISLLILLSHGHSINQVRKELALDRKAMEQRFPAQYMRVKATYDAVSERARLAVLYPWAIGGILALATLFTVYAFCKVPPVAASIPIASASQSAHP